MHRCILRNDQTVEPEVIVQKRDLLFSATGQHIFNVSTNHKLTLTVNAETIRIPGRRAKSDAKCKCN